MNRDNIESVEEVLSKPSLKSVVLQIAQGSGYKSHIYRNGLFVADSADRLLLKSSQEFDLKVEGKLSDLIEKEGASTRFLEKPFLVSARVGEGSLLVTEEL